MPHHASLGDNIEWLKEHCFSDPERRVHLEKGAKLLRPGQLNHRLYFILEGTLSGTIENAGGNRFEIFRTGKGTLVGAYSFFSDHHQSYSQVVAEEPCELAYLDEEALERSATDYGEFARRVLPVVVDEIYSRQLLAHRVSTEKQEAMQRLFRAEKLAMLGQMAAGLAHELNNALGVIQKKTYWLIDLISGYFKQEGGGVLYPHFHKGLQQGQNLSSAELRTLRRELQESFHLSQVEARDWARMGLGAQEIKQLGIPLGSEDSERLKTSFETGLALHDLSIAADHVVGVIHSVHDLAVVHRSHPRPINLNATLREALSLTREVTKNVEVNLELGELPTLVGSSGDWVQVWVNLIKNACEAMANARTPHPAITLKTTAQGSEVEVALTDNGPGIPEEMQSKIFQPSFTTKKGGMTFGLGLGLSIVQRIVESYFGSIRVESRPGQTRFIVRVDTR